MPINERHTKTLMMVSLVVILLATPLAEVYGQDTIPAWRDTTSVWKKGMKWESYQIGGTPDGIRGIWSVNTPAYPSDDYNFILAQRFTQPGEPGYDPNFRGERGKLPGVGLTGVTMILNGKLWFKATLGRLAPQFSLSFPEASVLESIQAELRFNSGLTLKKTVQFEVPTRFGPGPDTNLTTGITIRPGRETPGYMIMDCRTKDMSENIVQQTWSLYDDERKTAKTLLQKIDYFSPTRVIHSGTGFGLRYVYKDRLAKTGKVPTKVDLEFTCTTDSGTEYRSEYTLDITGYDPVTNRY